MNTESPRQIELRAIKVLEQLKRSEFREDSRVELKRELGDEYRTARRIAGHCNASRGDMVLWIIGADEELGVVGWSAPDFAEYLPKVWSYFADGHPACTEVSFVFDGLPCVALAFSTSRAPYLVKNPSCGLEKGVVIEREIPWRDGTRIRTANRDEVIRLLLDHTLTPQIEFFRGYVSRAELVEANRPPAEDEALLNLQIEFYAMPRDDQPVVIPVHRIFAKLTDHGNEYTSEDFRNLRFWSEEAQRRQAREVLLHARTGGPVFPVPPPEDSVRYTGTEVILSRAAHVHMSADVLFRKSTWNAWDQFQLEIILEIGVDRIPLVIASDNIRKNKNG